MEVNNRLFDALGMTLVDSLWQGAFLMVVAFLGLWFMKKSKAHVRHNFLLICILALPVLGIYTFNQRFERAPSFVQTNFSGQPESLTFETSVTPETPLSTLSETKNEAFVWSQMTPWLGIIWVVGMTLIFLRSVGAYFYLNRLKSGASHIESAELIRLFIQLKDSFGIKRKLLLKETDKISSPMVYGYFKPVILFPLGLIQGLTTEEVEVILLHELAHLKRNDFLINIVINGLRAVYFYHPVFWWMQSQLDNEREFASDEMVMEHRADGLTLVRALTKAKEFSMLSPSLGFTGSSKHQLLKRVNRIMKKQQKPNWAGLILPCLILTSAFLFTSQRKKVELTSAQNSEESFSISPNDTLPEYFGIDISKPGVFEEINESTADGSALLFDISDLNQSNDTLTMAQATMEFLEDPSPILVVIENGETVFKRNGEVLKGEALKVYQKAHEKLTQYSSNVADQRISGFMGGSNDLAEKRKELKEEKDLMNEMVLALTKNAKPTDEDAIALNRQANKVSRLEKLIAEDEKLSADRERAKAMAQQVAIENAAVDKEFEKRLLQMSLRLQNVITRQRKKLQSLIIKAESDPENEYKKAIDDQRALVQQLESELLAYPKTSNRPKSEKDWDDEIEERRREIAAKQAQLLEQQQRFEELALKVEQQNQKRDRLQAIQEAGSRPILEVDGKLRPDLELSDLDDVVSFSVLKGKSVENRYPNGETKGYDGLIVIKTFGGMTGLQLKGNGTVSTTTFSKDKSNYTFAEDNTGQSQAISTLEAAQFLEEEYVVVFNGKFMPKDYVFKYEDAFIKEINIYKGDALKKFPKRKVKDRAVVIEVITKKIPRRKN